MNTANKFQEQKILTKDRHDLHKTIRGSLIPSICVKYIINMIEIPDINELKTVIKNLLTFNKKEVKYNIG